MSLEDLYHEFPWKTYSKFKALANRKGFKDDKKIKDFFMNKVVHDERVKDKNYLPIYDKDGGAYQFDTLVQSKGKDSKGRGSSPFLIFININTRKAYAYEMKNKGASEVLRVMKKFMDEVDGVKSLTSDQDAAYLSDSVLSFIKEKGINYRTTEDENHNVLGIINRFIRTLRDLNHERDFSVEVMNKLVDEYNQSIHSSTGKAPDKMTSDEGSAQGLSDHEIEYIADKNTETLMKKEVHKFNDGDRVRIVLMKNKIGKNRSNLSDEAYIIDGTSGNNYLIRSEDGSVDSLPAYRLVKCDNRYKIAKTIKDGKRGVIDKIIKYDSRSNKYTVIYEGVLDPTGAKHHEGSTDTIAARNMREGNPTKLSQIEREFWAGKNKIPKKIRKWF